MKLTIGLIAASLFAQASQPTLSPLGPWALCGTVVGQFIPYCAAYTPGHEQYVLKIPRVGAEVAYRYSVYGFRVDGTPVIYSGVVEVAPEGIAQTEVALSFGGALADGAQIHVEALAVMR